MSVDSSICPCQGLSGNLAHPGPYLVAAEHTHARRGRQEFKKSYSILLTASLPKPPAPSP